MNEDLERLAWQLIDDEISPEDRERLDRLQAEDSELRAEIGQLRRFAGALSDARETAPPPELRPRIDRAVASASPSWRRPAPAVSVWRPRFAYLAAGLLVGAVVARLLLPVSDQPIDTDHVTGAMHSSPVVSAADTVTALGEDWGSLSQWRDGDLLLTALDLSEDLQVDLVLEAEEGVELVSVHHSGPADSEVQITSERLRFRSTGPGRHVVAVAPARTSTAVTVSLISGDELLANRRLTLDEMQEKP